MTTPVASPEGRTRSTFRFPRVAFDLGGALLGAGAYIAYVLSWDLMASLLSVGAQPAGSRTIPGGQVLKSEVLAAISAPNWFCRMAGNDLFAPQFVAGNPVPVGIGPVDFPAVDLAWWHVAAVFAWMLVLWSVMGGALSRCHALRIARDESVPADEAVGFAISNLRQFLMAPLFVGAAGAFFLACGVLAGLAAGVPVAGPVLQAVLQPLALLAGLVVVVIGVGALVGLPMMGAAVAVERNGALDAASRMFSYVYSRPLPFLTGTVIVVAVAGALDYFGGLVLQVSTAALALGASGVSESVGQAIVQGAASGRLLGLPVAADGASVPAAAWVSWCWTAVVALGIKGAVLSYAVGGFTDVYFLLREEVDGIPSDEVYVDGEDAGLGEPLPNEPRA